MSQAALARSPSLSAPSSPTALADDELTTVIGGRSLTSGRDLLGLVHSASPALAASDPSRHKGFGGSLVVDLLGGGLAGGAPDGRDPSQPPGDPAGQDGTDQPGDQPGGDDPMDLGGLDQPPMEDPNGGCGDGTGAGDGSGGGGGGGGGGPGGGDGAGGQDPMDLGGDPGAGDWGGDGAGADDPMGQDGGNGGDGWGDEDPAGQGGDPMDLGGDPNAGGDPNGGGNPLGDLLGGGLPTDAQGWIDLLRGLLEQAGQGQGGA